jgi:uncharacterized protein (TIGR03118 family)
MFLQHRLSHLLTATASLALAMGLAQTPAVAQYKITNLVSNQPGQASHTDVDLVNAWGISFSPTGPFWVSDDGTGLSTVYTGAGVKQSTIVTIPPASGAGKGTPTGQVYNSTTDFVVTQSSHSGAAIFLFATLDGTISGWAPSVNATNAVIAVNNSGSGAVYTGLAIGTSDGENFIYAADNANNKVDIYDGTFNFVGSFTDTTLPAGSAPYNVQDIKGKLYVTFTNKTGGGVVDIFTTAGAFVKTFATGGTLKSPWGLALAPKNFGPASNALLVGDLGDGRINYFNFTTGKFGGQLKSSTGSTLSISGLWGLAFGAGNSMNGNTNQLFFAAGPKNYQNGLFGVINFQ